MAVLVANDRVLITVNSLLFNQRLMHTFVYRCTAVTGAPAQSTAFDRLNVSFIAPGNVLDKFKRCCPEQLSIVNIWYQVISPARYAKFTFSTGAGVGTLVDNSFYSANAAAVILRRGELGIRSNISTLHVPLGQTPGCMANGNLGGDVQAPLDDLSVQMLADINTTGTIATYSPVIHNDVTAPGYTPIIRTEVMQTVRTMRRRGVGLGI